jgi:hypothetical protein
MPPIGDIDYIIMIHASEESFLWELLGEYKKEYPCLSGPIALSNLKTRLCELVLEGKVGIYSMEAGRNYGSQDEYQDLKTSDALAAIQDDGNWAVPPAGTVVLKCLYARDTHYFGTCFETET